MLCRCVHRRSAPQTPPSRSNYRVRGACGKRVHLHHHYCCCLRLKKLVIGSDPACSVLCRAASEVSGPRPAPPLPPPRAFLLPCCRRLDFWGACRTVGSSVQAPVPKRCKAFIRAATSHPSSPRLHTHPPTTAAVAGALVGRGHAALAIGPTADVLAALKSHAGGRSVPNEAAPGRLLQRRTPRPGSRHQWVVCTAAGTTAPAAAALRRPYVFVRRPLAQHRPDNRLLQLLLLLPHIRFPLTPGRRCCCCSPLLLLLQLLLLLLLLLWRRLINI